MNFTDIRFPRRPFRRRQALALLGALPFALFTPRASGQTSNMEQLTTSDGGPFVPTPWVILDEMLKIAEIQKTDVVYDLGSGDGRLVNEAVKRYGARGVGVERDAKLVDYSRRQAQTDNIADRVAFTAGDLFDTDLSKATVVTMYLLPRLMPRLVPKLRAELPVGARVVSHDYPLSPWRPDKTLSFDVDEKLFINGNAETKLFYYIVPARIAGRWTLNAPEPFANRPLTMAVEQTIDKLDGQLLVESGDTPMRDFHLRADSIRFGLFYGGRLLDFRGHVAGDTMEGDVSMRGNKGRWSAKRVALK
jgi:SAM-dependent methyltransferase